MSFFLTSIGGFSGNVAILTYTADIFINSGSSLSPNESSMIVGGIQLLGVYVATLTTDKFGRKLLMTISCGGTFLFLFIMASYDFMIDHEIIENSTALNWIPIFSLSMAVFVMSLGIASIPLMMITELVPHKVKTFFRFW
jgi:SP family facilitated glucose transporter-like MFS transporter 8